MYTMNPATIEIDDVVYTMHLGLIESTSLGFEDHRCFRADICLDYNDGGAQCTPSYTLDDKPDEETGKRRGSLYGHEFIIEMLRVVGVDTWEQVKGKRVYALKTERWGGYIEGLANASNPESIAFVFKSHAKKFRGETE